MKVCAGGGGGCGVLRGGQWAMVGSRGDANLECNDSRCHHTRSAHGDHTEGGGSAVPSNTLAQLRGSTT
jgi:hypothetical protein